MVDGAVAHPTAEVARAARQLTPWSIVQDSAAPHIALSGRRQARLLVPDGQELVAVWPVTNRYPPPNRVGGGG